MTHDPFFIFYRFILPWTTYLRRGACGILAAEQTGVGRIESVQPVIDAIEALRAELGASGEPS
jgi:hypothetical protein